LFTIPPFTFNDPDKEPENVPEATIFDNLPEEISTDPDREPEKIPENDPVTAPETTFRFPLTTTYEPAAEDKIKCEDGARI